MLSLEQRAAWEILKQAFNLVATELRQRWQDAREKKEPAESKPKEIVPGVSETLQETLKTQLQQIHDSTRLRIMQDDLKTQIQLVERNNRLLHQLQLELVTAVGELAAKLRVQIDDVTRARDKAAIETKIIMEKLAQEQITTINL